MSEELKPCPFCGGKAEITGGPEGWTPTFDDPDSGGDPIAVICQSCGCGLYSDFDDATEAINAWNRRTNDSRDEQWASLKRKLEGLHKCYKDGEQINYVIVGTNAIEKVQELMKELETKKH